MLSHLLCKLNICKNNLDMQKHYFRISQVSSYIQVLFDEYQHILNNYQLNFSKFDI